MSLSLTNRHQSLDVIATELILDILIELKKQGKAILIVEHKVDQIARIADRIILLENGHIAISGTPDAVMTDARFPDRRRYATR